MGVIHSILNVIHSHQDVRITEILFWANLPHKRAKRYLKKLENEGYLNVKEEGRSKIFHLTEEGREFLKELKRMKSFFDNMGFPL